MSALNAETNNLRFYCYVNNGITQFEGGLRAVTSSHDIHNSTRTVITEFALEDGR